MDLLDSDSVLAASRAVFAEYGRVDVLVNNAIYQGSDLNAPFMQLQPETLERVFQGYMLSPFLLTRAVVSQMLEQGGGVVINVTSGAGGMPMVRARRQCRGCRAYCRWNWGSRGFVPTPSTPVWSPPMHCARPSVTKA